MCLQLSPLTPALPLLVEQTWPVTTVLVSSLCGPALTPTPAASRALGPGTRQPTRSLLCFPEGKGRGRQMSTPATERDAAGPRGRAWGGEQRQSPGSPTGPLGWVLAAAAPKQDPAPPLDPSAWLDTRVPVCPPRSDPGLSRPQAAGEACGPFSGWRFYCFLWEMLENEVWQLLKRGVHNLENFLPC